MLWGKQRSNSESESTSKSNRIVSVNVQLQVTADPVLTCSRDDLSRTAKLLLRGKAQVIRLPCWRICLVGGFGGYSCHDCDHDSRSVGVSSKTAVECRVSRMGNCGEIPTLLRRVMGKGSMSLKSHGSVRRVSEGATLRCHSSA